LKSHYQRDPTFSSKLQIFRTQTSAPKQTPEQEHPHRCFGLFVLVERSTWISCQIFAHKENYTSKGCARLVAHLR